MANQEVYDANWFRDKFKTKPVKQVMSAADYQALIKKSPSLPQKGSNIKASILQALKDSGLPYTSEHKFCHDRKFRFDWAIVTTHFKIGIEYEGLMSKKSRHTTIGGFSKDTEKYNIASAAGWVVLRYTALTYKNMMRDVLGVIEKSVK